MGGQWRRRGCTEFIAALGLYPAASLAEAGRACMLLAAYTLVAEVGELFEMMGRMPGEG